MPEILGFWCPLTALEECLDVRGQVSAYRGPFLLHDLDAVVHPIFPRTFLLRVLSRLHFVSMDLRPASPCPTCTRMNKRHGFAGGNTPMPRTKA
jgi:hypothetical protein